MIVGASLLLCLFAIKMTPREEEPQIVVPMVDIYLPMPGSSPREVQKRVVKHLVVGVHNGRPISLADVASIEDGAVRFRPMLLTGAAVVWSFVIVFDPIFQGLAIAMMCGEIASTTLSRVTNPILYYLVQNWKERHAEAKGAELIP